MMDEDYCIEELIQNQQAIRLVQNFDLKGSWLNFDYIYRGLHWVSIAPIDQNLAKEILKKLALEHLAVLEVWKIKDVFQVPYFLIYIIVIQAQTKLDQFLNQMCNLFKPIVLLTQFRIQEGWVFNRYGSYQALPIDFECIVCLDTKRIDGNHCCGKRVCSSCKDQSKPCPYCRQQILKARQLTREEIVYYQELFDQKALKLMSFSWLSW